MKARILNLDVDNVTLAELLAQPLSGVIFTPNVDHFMRLQTDREFYSSYKDADYILCDGKIVQWVSHFLGTPIKEKISGSDFFPAFCLWHKENPDISIFLLGGAEGVAEKATENINHKVGRDIIVGYGTPSFGYEQNESECVQMVRQVNESGATVLALAVGTPKQEKWIAKYKNYMPNVKIFIGIGATIDFEAGNVRRSSRWISEHGLEWLYRLVLEPKRLWRRYLITDMPFFWLILKQKAGLYRDPFDNDEHSLQPA